MTGACPRCSAAVAEPGLCPGCIEVDRVADELGKAPTPIPIRRAPRRGLAIIELHEAISRAVARAYDAKDVEDRAGRFADAITLIELGGDIDGLDGAARRGAVEGALDGWAGSMRSPPAGDIDEVMVYASGYAAARMFVTVMLKREEKT